MNILNYNGTYIFTKTRLSFLILCIIFSFKLNAQESYNNVALNKNDGIENKKHISPLFQFNAYSWSSELEIITPELSGTHIFGVQVAKKLYLFEKKYTSEESISPGNPQTKTIIKKPLIFNAVKHIEKSLKKSVKKGELTNELAASDFDKVLEVALNILTADTRKFEAALKDLKEDPERIELFTKGVKLNY